MKSEKEFLRNLMVKKHEEMEKSEFACDKDYSFQLFTMFSIAAGATPSLPICDVWNMAREVVKP